MIYITGAGGQIGRSLVSKMEIMDLDFIKIHHADYQNISFQKDESSVLIHLGWETKVRTRAAQEQCRVNSYDLINSALVAQLRIIYISSDSALSATRSNYGYAKYLLEEQLKDSNVTCVRLGFIDFPFETKNYIKTAMKIIKHNFVMPRIIQPELRMRVAPQEKLIESLLELISNPTETGRDLSEIHRTYTLEEYLLKKLGKENSKLPLKIPIPSILIMALLKCTSILSRQRTNWHDSFLGLVDSNRKADLHV